MKEIEEKMLWTSRHRNIFGISAALRGYPEEIKLHLRELDLHSFEIKVRHAR